MTQEQVVLVDENDNQVGLMDKLEAHKGKGTLHRAVSVLLYRKKNGKTEVLLQQRSKSKPLWPLYWSNTVCTHPRKNETGIDCVVRRLDEELGITISVKNFKFIFKLLYQAKYNEEYSEYELDSVFIGEGDETVNVNQDEVNETKWMEWQDLLNDIHNNQDKYTPWFILMCQDKRLKKKLS